MMKQRTENKKQKYIGATLIEMVIYIFLLLTLMAVLTDVFSTLLDLSKEATSFSELEQDAKFIMQKLINEVANAEAIFAPVNLGDSSNTVAFTKSGTAYTFFTANNNLMFNDNISSEQLNSYATTVSNFNSIKLGNSGGKPLVKVSFRLTNTLIQAKGAEAEDFEITIGTR